MSRSTAATILILSALQSWPALRAEPKAASAGASAPKGGVSASAPPGESNDALREQVRRAETAFAKSMADRDHTAFTSFLADEAIFVGPRRVLRGKQAVADGWKPLYEGPPPFSWRPETVEVVDSGTLALSSGPVMDETGKRTGTYNSTWRREPDGRWKIVLDIGCPPCEPPPAGEPKKK